MHEYWKNCRPFFLFFLIPHHITDYAESTHILMVLIINNIGTQQQKPKQNYFFYSLWTDGLGWLEDSAVWMERVFVYARVCMRVYNVIFFIVENNWILFKFKLYGFRLAKKKRTKKCFIKEFFNNKSEKNSSNYLHFFTLYLLEHIYFSNLFSIPFNIAKGKPRKKMLPF